MMMMNIDRWISIVFTISLTGLVNNQYNVKAINPSDIPIYEISSNLTEQQALDRLLSKSRYDSRSGPPSDVPVIVTVGIMLLTLASPDESSLKYEVEFMLNMVWTDNRLRYRIINDDDEYNDYINSDEELVPVPDKEKYDRELALLQNELPSYVAFPLKLEQFRKPYLDALCHVNKTWTPDVYFIKHGDFRQHIDPRHLSLRIFANGTVNFTTRKYLILHCSGQPKVFPFDVANCSFSLESVSHEKHYLEFRWLDEKQYLKASNTLRKLNAYLHSNKTWYCSSQSVHERGNYSCLQLELIFTRDQAFYFTTVFIPGIILVTSSFITFWLEWNAVAARIMLGVTTMLNFFITSNRFRATLPVVSELQAMNIWEAFSMVFIYSALLEFIVVNYIGRKRPRITTKNADAVETQGIEEDFTTAANEENNDDGDGDDCNEGNGGDNDNEKTKESTTNRKRTPAIYIQTIQQRIFENPIKTAKTIDVISRAIFPFAYSIFLIYFFLRFLALNESNSN